MTTHYPQLTLDPHDVAPKVIIPSSRDAIPMPTVTCSECSDPAAQKWHAFHKWNTNEYMYSLTYFPCHEWLTECCTSVALISEVPKCEACNSCNDCCDCIFCDVCDLATGNPNYASAYYVCEACAATGSTICESCCNLGGIMCNYGRCHLHSTCESCACCDDHCSCRLQDGWLEELVQPTSSLISVKIDLKHERDLVDPVRMMADFYLCEFVMFATSLMPMMDYERIAGDERTNRQVALWRDAKRLQDHIISLCLPAFRNYAFAAIGGELRHSSRVDFPTYSRSSTWDYWHALGEVNDRAEMLAMAEDDFANGSWSAGYGGDAWASCTRTLRNYESGISDAKTFVDNMFSLQHNGGSFLNKMKWAMFTAVQHGPDYCQTIGNAHRDSDVVTLLREASHDAIAIFCRLRPMAGKYGRVGVVHDIVNSDGIDSVVHNAHLYSGITCPCLPCHRQRMWCDSDD